jgi:hypothetical protein
MEKHLQKIYLVKDLYSDYISNFFNSTKLDNFLHIEKESESSTKEGKQGVRGVEAFSMRPHV